MEIHGTFGKMSFKIIIPAGILIAVAHIIAALHR